MAALASLAFALLAQAAPAPVPRGARLIWARAPSAEACVGKLGLAEDIKNRLGWDPFVLPVEVEIEGTALRTGDGFRATLSFRDATGKSLGSRELRSHALDCRSLGEAIAVAVTVAIAPRASGAPVPSPEPSPFEEPAAASAEPQGREAEPDDRVRVALMGGITAGVVPGPSDVATLRVSLPVGRRAELGVGMTYFRESRSGDFAFGVTAGELRGCVDPWGIRGLPRFCGAMLVGAFEANVRAGNLTPVEVGTFAWAAAEIGPALSAPLIGPLRLETGASAIIPIVRRQGFLRGSPDAVWEQSTVGGRVELGLGLIF